MTKELTLPADVLRSVSSLATSVEDATSKEKWQAIVAQLAREAAGAPISPSPRPAPAESVLRRLMQERPKLLDEVRGAVGRDVADKITRQLTADVERLRRK